MSYRWWQCSLFIPPLLLPQTHLTHTHRFECMCNFYEPSSHTQFGKHSWIRIWINCCTLLVVVDPMNGISNQVLNDWPFGPLLSFFCLNSQVYVDVTLYSDIFFLGCFSFVFRLSSKKATTLTFWTFSGVCTFIFLNIHLKEKRLRQSFHFSFFSWKNKNRFTKDIRRKGLKWRWHDVK